MGFYCKCYWISFEIIYDNIGIELKYCPFCGYELDDKDDEIDDKDKIHLYEEEDKN